MSTASDPNSKGLQRAQSLFQYGNDAALKNNFDYAIQMYREAIKLAPENLIFRQALRGVQRRKFGNEPSKVGRLVGARVQPIMLRAKTARARGRWAEVIEVCEDAFDHNPWDISVSQSAAEAAEQLKQPALAKWYLESVLPIAGEDAGFFRQAAKVYALNEDWERAIHCWERVKKISPNDEDAGRQIKALSASATITRSGLHDSIQRGNEAKAAAADAAQEAQDKLDELKAEQLTPEQRLLKRIEEEPTRAGPYLELADLYKMHNKLDDAERALAKGIKALPNDEVLLSAHAEVQIARLQRYIDVWKKKAKDDPADEGAKQKLAKATSMLNDYEIKELRRKSAVRPADLELRYQLGLRLIASGLYDEAIAEFQQARSSPALKVQALHQAGVCFEAKDLPKLAERNYQEALKLADPHDAALLNALHYRLGRVAESQGDLKSAEDHYNEVAANDYTYMDVAVRLRSLNQKP